MENGKMGIVYKHAIIEDVLHMAEMLTKRCLSFISVQGTANGSTVRYCFTYTRLAITRKLDDVKHGQECGALGTLVHCWWLYKPVELFCSAIWQASAKLSACIFYDPAVFFLIRYHPRENLSQIRKRIKMVLAALFMVARSQESGCLSLG